ncbi:MAG: TonB-dependent receptor [Prevotellaceae bacterium]|nr:TonB-dependent receptor [Prevotella sp.]MDD7258558.1 TonB-dependent receptor [Prevotellaceae bacterium]MDY6131496.1 TonB-dependent receptor [Prevotella sp.]
MFIPQKRHHLPIVADSAFFFVNLRKRMLPLVLTIFFLLPYATVMAQQESGKHPHKASPSRAQNLRKIDGRIYDKTTGGGIPFVSIYLPETEQGTVADVNGLFEIRTRQRAELRLKVTALGYATKEISVKDGDVHVDIALELQSVALEGFTVTAKYTDRMGSNAVISQEALEYIQPVSIQDLFQLLPGGKIGANNMQNRQLISSRQAGCDQTTSFGMGINVNGVPIRNDGMRIQLTGFTGSGPADKEGNVDVNTGVDLRTISTDHIETVTVERGIASAKEGNVSSGTIYIKPKQGKSPLRARVKFDPLNKLAYVGKGVLLSERSGTLYIGGDIVRSTSSIDDTRGAYNRITAQTNWNNQTNLFRKKTDISISCGYTTSFNNNKSDDAIETFKESYKTRYSRMTLTAKIKAGLNSLLANDIELIASADWSQDVLEHYKQVVNKSVMPIQKSTTEGESEGEFLPQSYRTFYKIDNRPLSVFAQLTAYKFGNIGKSADYSLLMGASVSSAKNHGVGTIVDPLRPPFPSNDFIRPRPNSEIPAIMNQAGYVEAKLRYRRGKGETESRLGFRETMLLNLPRRYYMRGRMLWEPRLQLAYTLTTGNVTNTLRLGYGVENKLPSADFLYPDKVYTDFVSLNAYFSNPDKRRLITYTKIQNPANGQVKENKNRKAEIGWDLKYRDCMLSLTAFAERMDGGMEYLTTYSPVAYTYYYELKHPVDTKPEKEDFNSYWRKDFAQLRMPVNSAKIIKRGIEYRLHVPNINLLKSDIEINGAYYNTLYTSGVPVMYYPSIVQNSLPYPYVGIYDGFEKTYAENFNTNVWINTRLPNMRLIFTHFIQVIWFEKTRRGKDVSEYPQKYMDNDGQIHEFLTEMIEGNPEFKALKRDFLSSRYNELATPVSLRMNLKMTKEFGERVKLSFFADNLIQASPKYQDNYKHTRRNWYSPFFGAELTLNLF